MKTCFFTKSHSLPLPASSQNSTKMINHSSQLYSVHISMRGFLPAYVLCTVYILLLWISASSAVSCCTLYCLPRLGRKEPWIQKVSHLWGVKIWRGQLGHPRIHLYWKQVPGEVADSARESATLDSIHQLIKRVQYSVAHQEIWTLIMW